VSKGFDSDRVQPVVSLLLGRTCMPSRHVAVKPRAWSWSHEGTDHQPSQLSAARSKKTQPVNHLLPGQRHAPCGVIKLADAVTLWVSLSAVPILSSSSMTF
jgi:hypothetical protein